MQPDQFNFLFLTQNKEIQMKPMQSSFSNEPKANQHALMARALHV